MKKLNLDLPPDTKRLLMLVAAFAALLLFTGAMYAIMDEAAPTARPVAPVSTAPAMPRLADDPAKYGLEEFSGRIGQGQPFVTALLDAGIEREICDTIQKHLEAAEFNFRQCLPGQTFTAHVDSSGALRAFRYDVGRLLSYWITRDGGNMLKPSRWETPVTTELVAVEGSINTSVYHTILAMGEKPQLVADYADVLGYDIDFIFDPRIGDRFSILVEKQTLDGDIVGYGRILAASYSGEITGDVKGYFYTADSTLEGWFAPDGENLQKAFMRSPLSILRVTSTFGMRTHPISGRRKMHTGIDYAAPTGTPVWSVGSGTVVFAGYKGGYGKTIEVKHSGGVKTRYGHLSRIGVKVGQGVRQHQTIGAVGSTGLSTGPHLHFEYLVGGQFVQPRKVKNPSLKRLPEERMAAFAAHMSSIDSVWTATPRVTVRERRPAIASASYQKN